MGNFIIPATQSTNFSHSHYPHPKAIFTYFTSWIVMTSKKRNSKFLDFLSFFLSAPAHMFPEGIDTVIRFLKSWDNGKNLFFSMIFSTEAWWTYKWLVPENQRGNGKSQLLMWEEIRLQMVVFHCHVSFRGCKCFGSDFLSKVPNTGFSSSWNLSIVGQLVAWYIRITPTNNPIRNVSLIISLSSFWKCFENIIRIYQWNLCKNCQKHHELQGPKKNYSGLPTIWLARTRMKRLNKCHPGWKRALRLPPSCQGTSSWRMSSSLLIPQEVRTKMPPVTICKGDH